VSRVEATIALLEGGATVPFIARYRKEVTGNLDEVKIEDIDECRVYYTALEQRRETILASIQSQGKLTDELKQRILMLRATLRSLPPASRNERPRQRGARARASACRKHIWEQTGSDPVGVYALQFSNSRSPRAEVEAFGCGPRSEPWEPVVDPAEGGKARRDRRQRRLVQWRLRRFLSKPRRGRRPRRKQHRKRPTQPSAEPHGCRVCHYQRGGSD
jgi:uncharacterized protein